MAGPYSSEDILEAVVSSNLEAIQRILGENSSLINARGSMGFTPLHMAALRVRISIARALIESGADVNARKDDVWTPLHIASQNGDLSLVSLLLDHGADPNALSKDGQTPLHAAAHGIGEKTINILNTEWKVKGLDPPVIDHGAVIRLLVSKGSHVNIHKKSDGATPLLLAVYRDQEGAARILIELGADVNAVSFAGWAPLHAAAARCNEPIVRLLVESGADIEAPDKDGKKALEMVGMTGESINSTAGEDIVKILSSTSRTAVIEGKVNSKEPQTPDMRSSIRLDETSLGCVRSHFVEGSIRCSPDATQVAFAAPDGRKMNVYMLGKEFAGSAFEHIVPDSLRFSCDSKRFGYIGVRGGKYYFVIDGVESEGFPGSGKDSPIFSPDSAHFAYAAALDQGKTLS